MLNVPSVSCSQAPIIRFADSWPSPKRAVRSNLTPEHFERRIAAIQALAEEPLQRSDIPPEPSGLLMAFMARLSSVQQQYDQRLNTLRQNMLQSSRVSGESNLYCPPNSSE